MNFKLSNIAASVGILLAGATMGFSQTSLFITNSSFETPANGSQQIFIAGTGATSTFVTGWTCATTAGYWDINLPGSGGGITNVAGTQVLESYNIGGGVAGIAYQELTNTWVPGALYVMTARAGQPTGGNPAHTLDSVSIDTKNGSTLAQLSFATLSNAKPGLFNYTVTYTATGSEAGDGHPVVAYHVPSGNGVGGMWVDAFTLTMYTNPVITVQPVSQTNSIGANSTFSVTVLGGGTLSYQWQATNSAAGGFTNIVSGVKFGGATSASMTITNISSADALGYQVIVTNTFGSVTSSVANLTAAVLPPAIATQPTAQTGFVGGPATFSVTPSGTAPFSYQWQATNSAAGGFTNLVNGGQFTGATTNALAIVNLATNNALGYRVIVTNSVGSITSSVASLSVISQELINVDVGTVATQTGAAVYGASGDTWNPFGSNGGTLSNLKDSANITLNGVGFSDSAGVTLSSDTPGVNADTATTALMEDYQYNSGTLTVSLTGLTYTNYPYKLAVFAAGNNYSGAQAAKTTVTAGSTGTSPSIATNTSASQRISDGNGVAYSTFAGTLTGGTLTFTVAQASTSGINLNGMQLLIQDPYLIIASQPVSVTNAAGSTVNFSVSATGAALSYQWQTNGVNVGNGGGFSGATSSTLTLTNTAGSSPVNYQVVVSNSFSGAVTSSVATLSLTPNISTQPTPLQAVLTGNNASISVVADGSPTLTYQWQATNSAAGGFTNLTDVGAFTGSATSTLNINNAQAAQSLTYQVVVGNGFGSVTSTPSVLAVGSSPVVTGQPLSQTNNAGATVNFSVTATGSAPLAYQWQANGGSGYTNVPNVSPVSGATTSTLTIAGIADANALTYQVIITNSSGSVTSSPATLTVIDAPVIASAPASQSANVGSTVNFTVSTASGTAPFTYQWQTNGVTVGNGGIVSGATSSTLTLAGVTTNYALNYQAVVSNAAGSVTSSPAATLTVHVPASIVTQPTSVIALPGATASFSVGAAGDPTLAYQWQSGPAGGPFTNLTDNGQISGSSANTLTITNANSPVAISYQVVVTNNYGSVTSAVASLVLGKLINVDIGSGATQSGAAVLGASGDVWNGVTGSTGTIKDSTGTTLSGVAFADSSYFGFNNGGTTAMDAATTALMQDCVFGFVGNSASSFPVSLSGLSAYIGSSFTLVVYSGVGDPGQGANLTLAGATGGNTASTLGVSADTRQISAGIGHAYNTFTGTLTNGTLTITASPNANPTFFGVNGFQLLINLPDPIITTNPVSQTKVSGSTATFSVAATGSATLSYQWQATNSANGGFTNLTDIPGVISGSQSNLLTFTGVTANESLTYQVVVSNGSGSVTSSPASLNVLTIPIINAQPASQSALNGGTVTFTVGATGVGTLGYQWQTNGVNLTDGGIVSGSATSALTLAGVTTNNAVSYQVIVTNANGSVTSSPAILTVLPTTELINVDIGSAVNVQSGAAVLGASGDVWNGVTGSQGGIVDSASNLLSGVSFGDSSYFGFNSGGTTAMDAATTLLMQDCVFGFVGQSASSFPVSLSGLSVYNGEAFILVVYSGVGDPGQGANLTLAGATGGNTASTLGVSADTRQISAGIGHAYNTFTGTITNGTLTITASPNVNPTFFGINGFQLLLSPNVPPVITNNPAASTTNYTGTTATFSVGAVTATGSLAYQWQANGTNLTDGDIVSGSATSTLTLTGVTTNNALAYQVIVSNGGGSVTSSVANLTVFTMPVAGTNFTLGVTLGVPATVKIIGGKYSPTDANGFPLTITGVTGQTNGIVSTDGTNITYTATNTAASATNDSFTYTVSDGYSGTASQTVSVAINTTSAAAKGFNMIGTPQMIGGYEVLTYAGIPGFNYALDWTTNLTPPIVWTPIMTNPASANGSLILSNTPSAGPDFYRTRYVP